MNPFKFLAVSAAVLVASICHGQSAVLSAAAPAVSAGGMLTLTASASYPAAAAAVGWSVTLPEGWSFVATGGPDAPQVGPRDGATGTLDWAYVNVPPNAVRFTFTVKTAGRPGPVQLPAIVYLRVEGKQQKVEVMPLSISVAP